MNDEMVSEQHELYTEIAALIQFSPSDSTVRSVAHWYLLKTQSLQAKNVELRKALIKSNYVMLYHAGWNQNYDKETGKELPMSRPQDVQESEAQTAKALTP